jgi:hypothetical protein
LNPPNISPRANLIPEQSPKTWHQCRRRGAIRKYREAIIEEGYEAIDMRMPDAWRNAWRRDTGHVRDAG